MNPTLKTFLALSVTLHAGVVVLAATSAARTPSEPFAQPDPWAGPGVEVDAVRLPSEPSSPKAPAATPQAPPDSAESSSEAAPARAEAEPSRRAPEPTPQRSEPRPSTPAARSAPRPALRPRAEPGPAASSPVAAASTTAPEAAGAAFGASGLPPGVRHLPNAFTRALAIANRGDRRWQQLPVGRAGEARVELAVSETGELGELEFANERERDELAPVVRRLLDNTVLLLRAGRFSIDPKRMSAGLSRLRVTVEVSEREGANPEGDPSELFGVAWEAPRRDKPGRSGFVLNSGRQVTAWVWIE